MEVGQPKFNNRGHKMNDQNQSTPDIDQVERRVMLRYRQAVDITPERNAEVAVGEMAEYAREIYRELTAANQALAASIEERRVLSELFTTKLAESQQREAGLREALKPFAMMHRDESSYADSHVVALRGIASDLTLITEGDFRRASKALTSLPPSVVPWEVVEPIINTLVKLQCYGRHTEGPKGQMTIGDVRYFASEAVKQLESYAPQQKEKQV